MSPWDTGAARAADWLARPEFIVERLAHAIVHLRMSTWFLRRVGLCSSAYRVGDLLVDSGFAHARRPLVAELCDRPLAAICCTHHHEDHVGNCGVVARRAGCPVYLRNAVARSGEGVSRLLPYRRVYWGAAAPYEPEEMPAVVGANRRLRAIATPGHSATHTALLEEDSGVVFTGDLFVSPGASAVMRHENPYESVASLRRVAALEPSLMLTGHGLALDKPAAALRAKADRIEAAAGQAVRLREQGVPTREVVRRLFPTGRRKDRSIEAMTQGEFSRACFVRAAVAHRRR
jgi:ribonuclease/clavin/mitogillin